MTEWKRSFFSRFRPKKKTLFNECWPKSSKNSRAVSWTQLLRRLIGAQGMLGFFPWKLNAVLLKWTFIHFEEVLKIRSNLPHFSSEISSVNKSSVFISKAMNDQFFRRWSVKCQNSLKYFCRMFRLLQISEKY